MSDYDKIEETSASQDKSSGYKKSKSSPTTKKETRKSQKVKVLVSVYRYGDRIISALGIPKKDAWVIHRLDKSKLKPDELFDISSTLKNSDSFRKDVEYRNVINHVLDNGYNFITLPERKANELKDVGNLYHEILNIEIELFTK